MACFDFRSAKAAVQPTSFPNSADSNACAYRIPVIDENYSQNNGREGPTEDREVETMRLRQIRNMLATLFLSRGVPMLLGGDEFRRTQSGNNNAYCQDNLTSWYDWKLAERNADLIAFVKELIAFRKQHLALSADRFYSPDEITWLGEAGRPPDWDGPDNVVGCVIQEEGAGRICLLFNASRNRRVFHLPDPEASRWRVVIDTSKATASAVRSDDERNGGIGSELRVEPRSVLVLICRA